MDLHENPRLHVTHGLSILIFLAATSPGSNRGPCAFVPDRGLDTVHSFLPRSIMAGSRDSHPVIRSLSFCSHCYSSRACDQPRLHALLRRAPSALPPPSLPALTSACLPVAGGLCALAAQSVSTTMLSVERPDIRYASNGDDSLAYQVVGDGQSTSSYPGRLPTSSWIQTTQHSRASRGPGCGSRE